MQLPYRPQILPLIAIMHCGLVAACGESSGNQQPPFTGTSTTPDAAAPGLSDSGTGGGIIPAGDAAQATLSDASGLDATTAPGPGGGTGALDAGDAGAQPTSDATPGGNDANVTASDASQTDAANTAPACTGTPLTPGDHEYMIQSKNGQKYSYILNVPASVDPTRRAPVIVHWHALSSDPEEARKVTSINAKGETAKALLVFPRSPDKSWDVGSCCTTTVGGTRRDEEVFARELIKDVIAKACVDEKRIYSNGFSNGGMISQMLACKMGDVFAAVAPLGSTLTIPKADCKPSRPMPIFMLNGTADPLVGYNSPGSSGGLSVPDDVKFWAEKNGCMGTPETFLTMGKVTCTRYTQCSAGAEVAHCAVNGMGHCVPGMKTESASNCLTKVAFGLIPIQLGMPNNDIDALQMDIDFLLRFTLP